MSKLITTFEEAAKAKGIDPATIDIPSAAEELKKPIVAAAKLMIIIDVLNGDWKPDWTSYEEEKYYPWWDMDLSSSPSGFGLLVVDCGSPGSAVGSRFVFRTKKLAEHAAKHFFELYKDLMTK